MKVFPTQYPTGSMRNEGMDLRDYFAAKAMSIAILHYKDSEEEIPYLNEEGYPMDYEPGSFGTWYPHTKFFAECCYAIADQMMEAREKCQK